MRIRIISTSGGINYENFDDDDDVDCHDGNGGDDDGNDALSSLGEGPQGCLSPDFPSSRLTCFFSLRGHDDEMFALCWGTRFNLSSVVVLCFCAWMVGVDSG